MVALRRLTPGIDFAQARIPYEQVLALRVTMDDFQDALGEVEPSALREVFAEVPDVGWEDVGGLGSVKQLLVEALEWPLSHAPLFARGGLQGPKGILLHGPPGTGKTLLVKAAARESGLNFIAVRGPELLSMWLGESERAVRQVFRVARQAAPCLLFLDELDGLAPRRGAGGSSQAEERVVSQLLTELDGIEPLKGVVVLAATNRPDRIDPALLRAGRFDYLVALPVPDRQARVEILAVHTRGKPLADDVHLQELAGGMEGLVGADIAAICQRAALKAIRRLIEVGERSPDALRISREDFSLATAEVAGLAHRRGSDLGRPASSTASPEA